MKPEILLVDDNPREAELALLAFREVHLVCTVGQACFFEGD